MSYPAIEVKARYSEDTEQIKITFSFINTFLRSISNKNLDTTGKYVKPKEEVIGEIKEKFEDRLNYSQAIKKGTELSEKESNVNIKRYDIVIGVAYIDDEGQLDHIGHYSDYKPVGPATSEISRIFKERTN